MMELVYLWVEDYKNIHRQGFNFSPRFRCEFKAEYETDEHGKERLKDNRELIICDKEDSNCKNIEACKDFCSEPYIKDFFGDNINVTAIVGKNGSGKSSVLEKIYNNYFGDEQPLAIYLVGDTLVYRSSIQLSPTNNTQLALARDDHPLGKLSVYHYSIASSIDKKNNYDMTWKRSFIPRYVNAYIKKKEFFQQLESMYNFDHLRLVLKDNSTRFLEKYLDEEFTKHEVSYRYKMNNRHKVTVCADADMSREKIIEIVKSRLEREGKLLVDSSETDKIVNDARLFTTDELEINYYDKNRKKILDKLQKLERIHRAQWRNPYLQNTDKYHEFDLAAVIAVIGYWIKNTEPCELEGSQIILYALSRLIKDKFHIYVSERENGEYQILKSYILDFLNHLKETGLEYLSNGLSIDEIISSIEFIKQYANYGNDDIFRKDGCLCVDIPINNDFEANINKISLLFNDDNMAMANTETRLRVFELDLFNSKVGSTYSTISDGERQFIHFAADMIFYLSDFSFCQTDTEKVLIYLMDEPDNSLHPIWKKQLVDHAVSVCNAISASCTKTSVQLIFTTHSPFLLSDIPKQNIIFLDTDEEGKCKVLKHDEVMAKKETFGANIHTLLSDSFFMSDGLMGEFAKGKIDEIIVFHEKVAKESKKQNPDYSLLKTEYEEAKTKFWQTQSIIGEDYLKQIIENHLVDIVSTLYGASIAKQEEAQRLRKEADRLDPQHG